MLDPTFVVCCAVGIAAMMGWALLQQRRGAMRWYDAQVQKRATHGIVPLGDNDLANKLMTGEWAVEDQGDQAVETIESKSAQDAPENGSN